MTEADLPQNLRSLYQKAESALHIQNHGYAVELLLPIIKQAPEFLEGRKKLRKAEGAAKKAATKKFFSMGGGGLSFMKVQGKVKKEPLAAINELEDLLKEDPYNPQGNNLLYEAAMNAANAGSAGMIETAAFALETIREGNPEDTKNMHRLAEHYVLNKEPEKAADIYQAIVRVDPTDGVARKGLTNANAQSSMLRQGWGQKESVRDLLRNKDQSSSLEADNRKGMTREQLEERLAEWSAKYAEDQTNITVVKRIADIYENLEDFNSALSWYEYAFSISNGDVSLQAKVSHLHEKIDEMHIHELQEALTSAPDSPDAAQKQAELDALRQTRVDRQIANARDRVERNPTDPAARFDFGVALYNGGHFTDAIPELQRAKSNPHIRTKALLTLARCFEGKGVNDIAANTLAEAVKDLTAMDAVKKEILYSLGLIHDKMGRKPEALECFKQIYEADYGYLDVATRVESSY